ncbi:cystathionine gamma-lyase [Sinisalibacter lacisalsi]|uniref:Cystathionine gamma-lyase n=1 Tax=Sinisalibacter lacisalsi TaxID=1526570 RepID=A0ABQ1QPA9_9RHOB|nr:cystathionine gamma-lyase [Sinisalibacter lacisalsi]GGD35759.1 cystathionine gamma-lyase [Sinisalibacter lacisalsi]
MSDDKPDAAALLHLRAAGLVKGAPLALPITPASMFRLPGEPEAGVDAYGRMSNPTWVALEEALGHLEGAPVLAFPSGMAAITAALFATLEAGDRLLLPADGYYTPRVLADRFLKGLGITVETRPTTRLAEGGFEGIRAVLIETPSNPGLDLCDLEQITAAIRAAGGVSIVDNTTMTPFGQAPLALGADIVVASDTKAPGGHSDLLMGHVASRDTALLAAMRDWRTMTGSIPGAFDAWLLHRSLETLELRFERMCDTADAIAPRLARHRAVHALSFPGLPDHPQHGLATRQMRRAGFLIGLSLADAATAERFIAACPLIEPTTSFGGVHTTGERRARWGDDVAPGFVRLSVGTEPADALWDAIDRALTDAEDPGGRS